MINLTPSISIEEINLKLNRIILCCHKDTVIKSIYGIRNTKLFYENQLLDIGLFIGRGLAAADDKPTFNDEQQTQKFRIKLSNPDKNNISTIEFRKYDEFEEEMAALSWL